LDDAGDRRLTVRRGAIAIVCGAVALSGSALGSPLRPAIVRTGAPSASPLAAAKTAVPSAPVAHDLHLAYGDMAVEGSVIAGRIRLFKDDLERALGPLVGATEMTLELGAEADALVMRYVRDNLRISVDGQELRASLLGSGEDAIDLEPVWWVIVQYRAPAPPAEIHVRNTLLFDVFDDQRNIFKFVHFPDETQRTFYFAEGESEHVVRF
jgi:hypothetical protein